MKKIILLALVTFALFACKSKENNSVENEVDTLKVDSSAVEYTCPMHPEVRLGKPGTCPTCGMELQAKS